MLSHISAVPVNPQSAVFLLHGYGSNGYDMASLAHYIQVDFPNTAFFCPNAPTPLSNDGFEWFSLDDYQPSETMTLSYLTQLNERAQPAVTQMKAYLETIQKQYGIPMCRIVIGGFSQGGLIALKTAFDLIDDVAGIIGMSAVPLNQPTATQKRLPVLLTHGQADDVVPFAGMEFNQAILQQMNQNVSTCVQPFMGHNIDETCLQAVRFFLTSCLSEYPHDPDNS